MTQRDRELERQLDKQKMDSIEDELIETQRALKRLERENKRLQDTQTDDNLHRAIEKVRKNNISRLCGHLHCMNLACKCDWQIRASIRNENLGELKQV